MKRTTVLIAAGMLAGLATALWCNRDTLKERQEIITNNLAQWRKERIRDAYYQTLTQEDVAWG